MQPTNFKEFVKNKFKKKKASTDAAMTDITIVIIILYMMSTFIYASPYFSDNRVTDNYVGLLTDYICSEPVKASVIDSRFKSKLDVIQNCTSGNRDKVYTIQYFVSTQADDWKSYTEVTNQIGSYKLKQGNSLLVEFKKNNRTPFEYLLGQTIHGVIVKEGMIQTDVN